MTLKIGIPNHSTLARRSATLSLATALTQAKGPVTVVIDSTGLKVHGAGEWHRDKPGG